MQIQITRHPGRKSNQDFYEIRRNHTLIERTTDIRMAFTAFMRALERARSHEQGQAQTQTHEGKKETIEERLQSFPDWAATVED